MNIEQITKLEGLRKFYEPDNKIGLMLDELILDLRTGETREEIRSDAKKLLKELDPHSTAFKMISDLMEAE